VGMLQGSTFNSPQDQMSAASHAMGNDHLSGGSVGATHGLGGPTLGCCRWCDRMERRLRHAAAEAEHSLLGLPTRSWAPSSARTALDLRCPTPPPGTVWGHALCIDVIDAGCGPAPGATLSALVDGAERAEHAAPIGTTLPPRPDGATVGALPGAPCLFAVSTAVPLADTALPSVAALLRGAAPPKAATPAMAELFATGRTTRAGAVVGSSVAVSRSTRIPLADEQGRRSGAFLHLDFEALDASSSR
jgi:hypothetical protein